MTGRSLRLHAPQPKGLRLLRHHVNPILMPARSSTWESKAVFNPAAFVLDDQVHMLYRAIGDDDRSSLGHAVSGTGFEFERTRDVPAYAAREAFEGHAHLVQPQAATLAAVAAGANAAAAGATGTGTAAESESTRVSAYVSGGGGWGGVEDPRLTRMGDRLHMTYVAFDGWNPPRVAYSSISVPDFVAGNKPWEPPVLISPPDIVNKNAVLLPGKVRGQYVMLHRVYPDILIDYLPDLEFDGQTKWLTGQHKISPNPDGWDSHKLGAGAPPIETDDGWMLIYQGIGKHDRGRYKIGAMLLDKDRPERVVARPTEAILEPEMWYENHGWKAGVAYPCGAVIKDGQLIVYYGGADTYVCAASAPLKPFLRQLRRGERPRLRMLPSIRSVLRNAAV